MKHLYLPLILFLLIVIEGISVHTFPFVFWDSQSVYIPHYAFAFLIMIAIFYDEENTYFSGVYALIFGLLIDIAYTDVLGVYMFSYALVIYIINVLSKYYKGNFYMTLLIGIIGISLTDALIHLIYMTIDKTNLNWNAYLNVRLIPTLLINSIFLIVIYPLFRKHLIKWRTPS